MMVLKEKIRAEIEKTLSNIEKITDVALIDTDIQKLKSLKESLELLASLSFYEEG